MTALMYASSNGHFEMVLALLAVGADKEAQNNVSLELKRSLRFRLCAL